MAFKFKTFAAVGALIGSLALLGCGQDEKDPNHIKVGVIVGAEQQVAEAAQKVAKEKYGLDVELVTFNDYVSAERSPEQRRYRRQRLPAQTLPGSADQRIAATSWWVRG
jgi:ABC-type metal ion transport system substrate-binding protein